MGHRFLINGSAGTGQSVAGLVDYFARRGHVNASGNSQGGPRPDLKNGLKKVQSGEIPSHDTYSGREHPEWAGAKEYKVPDGGPQSGLRILKLIKADGTVIYGWTKNHYKNITPF